MQGPSDIDTFISAWAVTGGSELANTQSFVNGLCALLEVDAPKGSQTDDAQNDYVFERRVFQDNGDGTKSFGRLDAYKRGCFVLEAKQGSDADREAAKRGEADFFGKPASEKLKQGTARRGTPGWAAAMFKAKGQAERYAKALPLDHGWPPFLLVTDVGHCIDVYADFSGTGKAYTQFSDAARFRIRLEDLHDDEVRERLAAIWTNPLGLDPSKEAARVTRDIANQLAALSKRLEAREQNPTKVADFLMRCLFTMFAEDVNLIPEGSFTSLLEKLKSRPENFVPQVTALWAAMDTGGFVGALGEAGETVRRFNGYLFKDTSVIALEPDEIVLLIAAASHKWNHVEPAIFGTLLERALDSKERAKLGAHYTPRAYVDRLVMPTVIEPLRADWAGVQGAAASLIEAGKDTEAREVVEAFHAKLAATKVLDPACGTGNFLYVALARMKELEGEVIGLLAELGADQYVAELTGHTITPENFLGIEINPRAAAIAQLVLWIGYLQWHFRVNGEGRMPPEPVLRDVKTIENRDALIDWDEKVLVRDEQGKPLTIWDGTTMKLHPVTGNLVPDEIGRTELFRYVKPRATRWPKADYIVGNPPFIGNKRMRERLGDGYTEAVRKAYPNVSDSVDFVMYWWSIASANLKKGSLRRFGYITTNSISQTFNRTVIETSKTTLVFVIPDHPWVDANDGAAVRIAMTVGSDEANATSFSAVVGEQLKDASTGEVAVELTTQLGVSINPDLSVGLNIRKSRPLLANARMAFTGMYPLGDGFIIHAGDPILSNPEIALSANLKAFFTASDLTRKPRGCRIIDFYPLSENDARQTSMSLFQHVMLNVKPVRDVNPVAERRRNWWLFTRPIPELRNSLKTIRRFVAVPRTAKHFTFQFVDSEAIVDTTVVAIAADDAFILGILSSRIHRIWALKSGGTLEDRPRYQHESTFKPFPFPPDAPEPLKNKIRIEAEALDALRKQVLAAHDDLTLTKLYNVLEALKAGRALTDVERDIHDRGLITLIHQHHDAIDNLVAEAYGWRTNLADEDILTRLVALNKERAAEEAKGIIRWLRPEYQAPDYTTPVNATLDLGETAAPLPDNIIPWPEKLPDQVSAVAAILSGSATPLAPQDVARNFKGKRAATVQPVLDALAGIGMARRLNDGRYAA